jgi:putative hydrolase of the HAD superfamily
LAGAALGNNVRAVFFDAVGTLIHPDPPAAEVYVEAGRRHGSRVSLAEVSSRFASAFRRQEEVDRNRGWQTSEVRETERWRAIVAEVLDDVAEREQCFAELYEHFARPRSWRLADDAEQTLSALAARGYALGLASNYDQRLRKVVSRIPSLAALAHVVISSEVGWRKPSPSFFQALSRSVGFAVKHILLVGDDHANDYEGARAAGMLAVLLDPVGRHTAFAGPRIAHLGELIERG